MVSASTGWDGRRMARVVIAIALAVGSTAASAAASSTTIGIALAPGAGVAMAGAPGVQTADDGSRYLTLSDVRVRDAGGTGRGWSVHAHVESAGESADLIVDGRPGDDLRGSHLLLPGPGTTMVTVTASPAL
jgi:hypothetical protein